ncbi:hypothetical protein EHW97_09200 [Aeromicrobium camelliae]|uniref:Alternate-type signal peptide domain-containing protein n=1 Tax=Aeromicrobium camelliae TaxID=1538144 RepID=A0A3N6ZKX5_9ACTN|nr:TasA family protein [Aeromicrobium camelliae]RQN07667.1 hypothetical protein EHW97_09200 [Aeromicrobium camelliae]
MSKHRARRSGLLRAVLSLGLLLGLGVSGTMAYWTDQATVATGQLAAGRLDLTLNGQLAGPGGTTADTAFTVGDLVPGESFARAITVGNAGTVPLDYTAVAHTNGALGPGLRWSVVAGGTATNSGSSTNGNRTGTCTGGTLTFSAPTPVVPARRPLAAGASETLCITVTLDRSATSSLQGATATASFVVNGVQRGAP